MVSARSETVARASGLPACTHANSGRLLSALSVLALLLLPLNLSAAPAGTVIDNTAAATFSGGSTSNSNTVSITTVGVRTPSTIEFLKYAPGSPTAVSVPVAVTDYSSSGTTAGPFVPIPAPVPSGSTVPINLNNPVPLDSTGIFHQGEPVFIRLTDIDQNIDALNAETVLVSVSVAATGDTELLRLVETGPNTGIFTGYIQSYVGMTTPAAATAYNGQLGLQDDAVIMADYIDVVDGSDTSSAATLVDPFGLVFDSSTGNAVDGALVTLIDHNTNLPAMVYGDDGFSVYPSTVTSGSTVTDSGGNVYSFGPGEYRFPFVAAGTYRLEIVPPASHLAPSAVADAALQTLPGAPFALDPQGSRGQPFIVPVGPAIRIDIPLDPVAAGFFLVKDVNKRIEAPGGRLQYVLTLNNNTGSVASGTTLTDTLPVGLRYAAGSSSQDGNPIPDPAISADGRTLTFTLGDIADGTSSEIRYVVSVARAIRSGDITNRAVASANAAALVSNTAAATTRIEQDFLNERNVLMGRVVENGCATDDGTSATGLPGVRVYLENGTHVVTDADGRYHFEDVRPGSHVVQLDLETLGPAFEPVVCDEHSRFAGRPFSRFVDLQGGMLWRTDFHVRRRPPPATNVTLAMSATVRDQDIGYRIDIGGDRSPAHNLRLMVSLADDLRYLPGSSSVDGDTLPDPEIRGNVLSWRLADVPADWQRHLHFDTTITSAVSRRPITTKAFLALDSVTRTNVRTPVVEHRLQRELKSRSIVLDGKTLFASFSTELSASEQATLDNLAAQLSGQGVERIEAVGHTDNVPISPRSRHLYSDNRALSLARAEQVVAYLAGMLGLDPSRTGARGMGSDIPVASNSTADGRARNRRVELRVFTYEHTGSSRIIETDNTSSAAVEITGQWQEQDVTVRAVDRERLRHQTEPAINQAWVDAAKPGVDLVWPQPGQNPAISSIRIAVKHGPQHQVAVTLNGRPVSKLNADTRLVNRRGDVVVSRWAGIDIEQGSNRLLVEVRDGSGALVGTFRRDVIMSSLPVRAELVESQSRLVADGRQTPVIAVRLYDRDNRPIRTGLIGEFSVEAPHVAQQDIDDLQDRPLTGLDRGKPRYRVGNDGIALIELQPTTKSGEAVINIPTETRQLQLRPWLQAAQRDWILVGLAEGTAGYNTVNGNLESLAAADIEDHDWNDGKLSLFARGTVRGEWLLTLAYDSARDRAERDTLFQEVDPDAYFTVYGDDTVQDYDAASREKLYVRLERRQFYALFGDYRTGLTVTELTRFDRSMTGYKSEFRNGRISYNLFANDNAQNFLRDEIQGNGTSGLYRLRFTDLVYNSDKVRLETRDRFRPQLVVSTQPLTRHSDYDIDYSDGTLFFRQPVPSKDASLNPVYIVIDYETRDNDVEQWSYGGRGAIQVLDGRAEIGATYINEEQGSDDDTLTGIDATIDVTEQTGVRIELARSQASNTASREARLAELHHTGEKIEARAYYRDRETGFGLGQQSGIGTGTRLYGVDGHYRMTDRTRLTGEAWRQRDLQTGADREVLATGVQYEETGQGISAGLRNARDEFANGVTNRSSQLTFGAHKSVMDDRLALRINHDQSLNDNDNADYPTRTVFGADYLLNPSTTLFLEQELTWGSREDTTGTRIGMRARPWTGATLNTAFEQRNSEYGPRLFASAGLVQAWQVNDRWSLTASIDSSNTIREPGDVPFGVTLPSASANTEDFTATSLGASYQQDRWSWTSRLEHRNADSERKWGLYTASAGEPRDGVGLSARLQVFDTEFNSGGDSRSAELRLGLVRRPTARRWTVLDRLDLAVETQNGNGLDQDNWKIVNNLLLNYRRRSYQASLYHGAKYNRDRIDGVTWDGFTDSLGLEMRHDIGKRWDIGARGSILHGWDDDYIDYSYGLSVGYNPATNLWLSVGYNYDGYQDNDFALAGHTGRGAYIRLRLKFDQQSIRDTINWFNGQ